MVCGVLMFAFDVWCFYGESFLLLLEYHPKTSEADTEVPEVEDKEIIEAIRLCYEILKVAVEPIGAIGLAAVLSDNFRKNPT
ncbi:hypothetical protein QYF36_015669 [Acer negundo]|nr:hypothetical protein QYF36_015669 [Acer negundo]